MASNVPPITCRSCGAAVSGGAKFCRGCGAAMPAQNVCQKCGAQVPAASQFCTACGTPTPVPAANVSQAVAPNPAMRYAAVGGAVVAGVAIIVALAFALGWLGGGGDDAGTVVGADGGTVSLEGGPEIEILPGAIADDIEVTIGKSTQEPSLPDGLTLVGDVWDIGPSGTFLTAPARVTLPIPTAEDPEDIVGVFTLDSSSGEWVSVSSAVDSGGRTVSAFTNHLSPFAAVGGRAEAAKTGGWIRVENPYVRGSRPFPGGRGLPMHRENLVCFTGYGPVTNPLHLVRPSWDVVVATANWGETIGQAPKAVEFWMTAGTYTLEQSIFASEINTSPTYSPDFTWWTRPPQTIVLTPGMIATFAVSDTQPSVDYPVDLPPQQATGFVERPNACALKWSPIFVEPGATPPPADTPLPTPTTTEEPTEAAPPTEPAGQEPQTNTGGGWVLTGTDPSKEVPDTEGDCYHSQDVTISGLSATTYARCTGGSPAIDVWNRTDHSWSMEPPQTLTAGEILQITSTVSTEGTYQPYLSGGGNSWVSIYLEPGGGPYPGAGWAGVYEGDPPNSAVSEFTIPSGSEGGLMKVSLSFQGPGGSGRTTYTYEWQGP